MISEDINNIDINNIIINEPIKNSILQYSNFYKLSYSNDIITFNGIFININLNNIIKDNGNSRIILNYNDNIEIINKITQLEIDILNLLNIKNKIKQYKISEIFKSYNFKYSSNEQNIDFKNNHFFNNQKINNLFIIKISGIWETKEKYGITFKLININNLIDYIL